MKTTRTVRTLRRDEVLPEGLKTGFEDAGIYPDWCWVLDVDGEIVACALAMAGHGICFLLRIVATNNAPTYWFVVLLRRLLADCKKRGCKGFTVYFERPTEAHEGLTVEQKLAKIAFKAGCKLIQSDGMWALGGMDIIERWKKTRCLR